MNNWIFIYQGTVVYILQKEGMYEPSDCNTQYDTVATDPSQTFKVGDTFTSELQLQYNKQIWISQGLLSNTSSNTANTQDNPNLPQV